MSRKDRLKSPKKKKGVRISAVETPNYNDRPPVFSLQRIQDTKYCLSSLDKDDKSAFADAIYRRRIITWKEINNQHRHALGLEKISRDGIKAPIPAFITEDVDHFLAFRFNGKKAMVGYRQKYVFYVLWFDHDFSLYKH